MEVTSEHRGDPQHVLCVDPAIAFDRITPADLEAAAELVLAEGEALLSALVSGDSEKEGASGTTDLMTSFERHHDRFGRVYGLAQHFQSTCDSPGWRAVWAKVQPRLTDFSARWGQSQAVMKVLQDIEAAPEPDRSPQRQRLLDSLLLSMRLAGVALEGEAAEKFRAIQGELAGLSTRFAQTALDSRKAWSHLITDPAGVDGMPHNWRQITAAKARQQGHTEATAEDGPWWVTLDRAVAGPVLQHARNRSLRERVRRSWRRVAADAPHSNHATIKRILELRGQKATLLGFETYADLSLATKMAENVDQVLALTDRVVEASLPTAEKQIAALRQRAAAASTAADTDDFKVWDETFWSEREREELVGLTDDDLRPFFAFDNVLQGLFELLDHLMGVRFQRADLPTWHPDARAYHLCDSNPGSDPNRPMATVYIDPYSRPETKRSGAWMMPLVGRSLALGTNGEARRPAALIACNQSPPIDSTPSLMSFREVTTLFHEMGHALHHLLAESDDVRQSGIDGVEWDAVEMPSMFLECWVYHRPTLNRLARHHQTGERLPEDVISRLLAGRTHMGGTQMLRQAGFNRLDLAVHRMPVDKDTTPETIHAVANAELHTIQSLPQLPEDRFLCSFSHLFAGGYAAGYYSYMWASVLARDAFAAFTELNGDPEAEAALGRRWRHEVLAPGGSVHPMELFKRFRGREPSEAAALAWRGVGQTTASA